MIDDADMTADFGHCFVKTSDIINMNDYGKCVKILSHTYSLNMAEGLIDVHKYSL